MSSYTGLPLYVLGALGTLWCSSTLAKSYMSVHYLKLKVFSPLLFKDRFQMQRNYIQSL